MLFNAAPFWIRNRTTLVGRIEVAQNPPVAIDLESQTVQP
jgi:hypothetical protein